MNTDNFEQWYKLNKNLSAPLQEWNKTTTELFQKITQHNLEIMTDNVSRFSEQLKRLSNAKKPDEFITIQKDCINEDISATITNFQKIVHNTLENIEEISKLCGTLYEPTTFTTKTRERERTDK